MYAIPVIRAIGTPKSSEWMKDALCAKPEYRDYPWFPPVGNHWRQHRRLCRIAIAVCQQCPVIAECKTYADTTFVSSGIWAGKLYGLSGEG